MPSRSGKTSGVLKAVQNKTKTKTKTSSLAEHKEPAVKAKKSVVIVEPPKSKKVAVSKSKSVAKSSVPKGYVKVTRASKSQVWEAMKKLVAKKKLLVLGLNYWTPLEAMYRMLNVASYAKEIGAYNKQVLDIAFMYVINRVETDTYGLKPTDLRKRNDALDETIDRSIVDAIANGDLDRDGALAKAMQEDVETDSDSEPSDGPDDSNAETTDAETEDDEDKEQEEDDDEQDEEEEGDEKSDESDEEEPAPPPKPKKKSSSKKTTTKKNTKKEEIPIQENTPKKKTPGPKDKVVDHIDLTKVQQDPAEDMEYQEYLRKKAQQKLATQSANQGMKNLNLGDDSGPASMDATF